jgi:hypothetical protein
VGSLPVWIEIVCRLVLQSWFHNFQTDISNIVTSAGNLPTERVTKRDLFHIFHSYGKLAQISIKQAYGFIQFLEAPSCKRALEGEQGAIVRGRKVRKFHLKDKGLGRRH